MKVKNLRAVIRHIIRESILTERDVLSKSSVDSQIDSFLIKAEKAASVGGLDEADEPQEDQKEESPPEKKDAASLDLSVYAQSIQRLIENYDSLLSIETAILQRAVEYVTKNYDEAQSKELTDILSREYGLNLVDRDDKPPAPAALGAGPIL